MTSPKIPQEARDLHNQLVADLHDHINSKVDEHDFEKLLHRLKLKLPPMALLGCKNVIDVIEKLQKKGLVKPGKYEEFKKLIECIDVGWVDVINDREEEIVRIIDDANLPQKTASPMEDHQKLEKKRKLDVDQEIPDQEADGPTHSPKKRKSRSVYSKSDEQKGLAIILNFTKGRPGAVVDFKKLQDFLKKTLDFECHVEEDLPKEGVQEFLEETANMFNTKRTAAKYYCILVFIMSHGNEEGIQTGDDQRISLDDIVAYFKNDKLKYIVGKPKCFFVQACRGSSAQGAVDLPDDKEEVMIDEVVGKVTIPTDADLLMAYATTPGYYAYRRTNVGSWFFHNVIEIFGKHYTEEHVEDMLIDVKEALAYDPEWQTNEGYKQMPCTWSTLTKRLFLNP